MSLLLAVSFEHGHFVRRLFDKFRYLLRKWNGFLHLDDSMSSSTVRFLCFFLRHFFGDMIFRRRDAILCLLDQMLNPAKNRVRARLRWLLHGSGSQLLLEEFEIDS